MSIGELGRTLLLTWTTVNKIVRSDPLHHRRALAVSKLVIEKNTISLGPPL